MLHSRVNRIGIQRAAMAGLVALALGSFAAPARADDAAAAATPEQQEAARVRFDRGVELYEEGNFALAAIEFERAYATVPSYRVLYNIGQVRTQLGHYTKAIEAFEKFLKEGGSRIPDARRTDVDQALEMLRSRTALLTVRVAQAGAEVLIDDEPLGRAPIANERVDAGPHRLRIRKAGFHAQDRAVVLAGGDVVTQDFTLEAIEVASRAGAPKANTTPMWIAWGATAALGAGAAATGIVALGRASRLKEVNDDEVGSTLEDRERLKSQANTWGLTSTILTAGAVVAGGAALYFTLKPTTSSHVKVGGGPGMIRLSGTF